MTPSVAVVTSRDVVLGYAGRPVLRGLSGRIERGELLAVVGPNGGGKSTWLKALAGEIGPLSGELRVAPPGGGTVGYLPQEPEIDRGFPITVTDFAAMGLWSRTGAFGRLSREDRRAVGAALERTGLAAAGRHLLSELSGGQLQRTLFARTLLQDPSVILLDEPFASIDAETISDLVGILRAWHLDGRTIVASLHDLGQVRAIFPRTLLLAGRPIAWGATAGVLTPANLGTARRGGGALDPVAEDRAAEAVG